MGVLVDKKTETKVYYAIKISENMREALKLTDENPPKFLTFGEKELTDAIKMADNENSPVMKVEQEIISTYSVEYDPSKNKKSMNEYCEGCTKREQCICHKNKPKNETCEFWNPLCNEKV